MTYDLDLPSLAQIHNVFHMSLLMKHIGTQAKIAPALPPVAVDERLKVFPIAVLQKRMVKQSNSLKLSTWFIG